MSQSSDRSFFGGSVAGWLGVHLAVVRRWQARHTTLDSRRVVLTGAWEYDVTAVDQSRLLAAPSQLSVAFFTEAGTRQLVG
jgi:hypothetical protein